MRPLLIFANLAVLAAAVLSNSCGYAVNHSYNSARGRNAPQLVMHEWHDDGGPGRVTVRISLDDQIAEFERGGRYIGWCYVATGKEGHGTSPGAYRIMEKIVDKHSNKFGWIEDEYGVVVDDDATPSDPVPKGTHYVPAPMPYWMRLTSAGVGMHGGVIPNPGSPASHGCIRMPKDFAPVVFSVVDVGTPVTIAHGSRLRQPATEPQPTSPQPGVGSRRVVASRPLYPGELESGVLTPTGVRHGRPGT